MNLFQISIFCPLFIGLSISYAQQTDSAFNEIKQLPDKYYLKVDQKLNSVNDKLTKKSVKYLAKIQRQEEKLQKKLGKLNADAVNEFAKSRDIYRQLTGKIKTKATKLNGEIGIYNSYIDTLSTSLSFLKKFAPGTTVAKPIESLNKLQSKLQESDKIKEFVAQRKQQIKGLLSKYTKIPPGLAKRYMKLNKTAYYYSAQINEYKAMLKDPSKIEQKALSILTKLPAFQTFIKKNGMLSRFFPMQGDVNNTTTPQAGFAGLQTRAQLTSYIQQSMPAATTAMAQMKKNIGDAQSQLNLLRNELNKLTGSSTNVLEMPDFKPNTQKTKTLLQRLEYGANVQFAKSSNLFPSTADIGLSVGYKLNDKSIIGIGMGYKLGMGTLRRIVISHQAIGLRSFVDYKIKKSLHLSGGFEMNHNSQFKKIEQLKNFNDWQSSGLIGISKKYKVSSKVKGEIRLLYNFLANAHKPITQPIVFRLGYNF